MPGHPVVRVSRKGADRILSGHPWVFSSDVTDRGDAQPGDAVQVHDPRGRSLGTAHYSSTSQITLRLLSRQNEAIDRDFLARRLEDALAYRRRIAPGVEACRLVHAEGDRLPGLIIDQYRDYLVVQTLDQGMDRLKSEIVAELERILSPRGIVERNDVAVRTREQLPLTSGILSGEVPDRIAVQMNGLAWHADLLRGPKTGVFLDQRDNYLAAARYARGRALDCFTATGGFALHLSPRCDIIEAIDSSSATLDVARGNAAANHIANVEFREADVFDVLPQLRRSYDTIVLDPPAFTKSRHAVEGAARGYKEINFRALRLLAPGGILVTCSCSHHYSEAMLLETVAAAALDANRTLRVLERRTQSQDHPILLTVPETHYLKCLILEAI